MNFIIHNRNRASGKSKKLHQALALLAAVGISTAGIHSTAEAGSRGVATGVGFGLGLLIGSQMGKANNQNGNANQKNNGQQRQYRRKKVSYGDPKIRKTQSALKYLGMYNGSITGRKNQDTIDAILNYQSKKGYSPSGVLTEDQRTILYTEARDQEALAKLGDPSISSSSQREQNKRIQLALKVLNFYSGSIDGQLGPNSRRSITAYQQQNGKQPTGVIIGNDFNDLLSQALDQIHTRTAALNNAAPAGTRTAGRTNLQPLPNAHGRANPASYSTGRQGQAINTAALAQQSLNAKFSPVEKIREDAKIRRPNDIAIIIGNRKYQKGVPPVAYSHRDADAVKAMIINDLGFSPENVIDVRDAGQGAMRNVFGSEKSHKAQLWRYADADGKSNIFVYYSGHGAPEIKTGKAYLVPVDADPNALEISGYPLTLMYQNLQKVPAKSITVMLDACFSGDSSNGMLIKSASPLVAPTAPKTVGKNFTVLTASSGVQLASWDDRKGHGIFTSHMVEGMKGSADANGDKKITAGELHNYVRNRVRKAARRNHGRDQQPSIDGDENLVLATY